MFCVTNIHECANAVVEEVGSNTLGRRTERSRVHKGDALYPVRPVPFKGTGLRDFLLQDE